MYFLEIALKSRTSVHFCTADPLSKLFSNQSCNSKRSEVNLSVTDLIHYHAF